MINFELIHSVIHKLFIGRVIIVLLNHEKKNFTE